MGRRPRGPLVSEAADVLSVARDRLLAARSNFSRKPLSVVAAFGIERKQATVWGNDKLGLACEELSAAVVQVHLDFLGGASGRLVDNIRLFIGALRGDRVVADGETCLLNRVQSTGAPSWPSDSLRFAEKV